MDSNITNNEQNEIAFCKYWSKELKIQNSLLLINSNFKNDYFFNRLLVHSSCNIKEIVEISRELLISFDMKYLYLYTNASNIKIIKYARENGFFVRDIMYVLFPEEKIEKAKGNNIIVKLVLKDQLFEWVRIFCNSFGIKNKERIIYDIIYNNYTKLAPLISYIPDGKKEKAVGCALEYTNINTTGLYCLGVLPRYRKMGVGSAILSFSVTRIRNRGNKCYIQTFVNENNALEFYMKNGFNPFYKKLIFAMKIDRLKN